MKGRTLTQTVNCQPLTAEVRFQSRPVRVGFVVDDVAAGHVSFWKLRLSPVSITSPVIRFLSFITEVIKSQEMTA